MRDVGRAAAWSGLDASFRMVIVGESDVHLNRLFRVHVMILSKTNLLGCALQNDVV